MRVFKFFHSKIRFIDYSSQVYLKIFTFKEDPKKVFFYFENYGFDNVYNLINSKKKQNTDEHYVGEYAKLPGTVLRLSAVLHIIEEVIINSK